MVEGVVPPVVSNPIPTRAIQGTQTHFVCSRAQRPTEIEPEQCLSIVCGGVGQQWPAAGVGALGALDLGMA